MKKKVNEGYFENLIQEVLLENKHSCEIVLKPSKELGKIRREKEEKKLTNVLNSMTDVQKQQLQIEQKQLDAFQQAPDTLKSTKDSFKVDRFRRMQSFKTSNRN